jgi:putative Mg2+ transporter-C (MgtC) family protein
MFLESLQTLSLWELILRVCIAAALGAAIGIDRDVKNKPVDFRAYMIVCLATCMLAILGQELYATYAQRDNFVSLDLGKIISGVLTGIGFLGAGAILRDKDNKNEVIGTATGASIWGASILGLCIGFGYFTLAFIGFFTILIILIFIGYIRKKVK